MSALQIEQKIRQLPFYLLPEVLDYVDFLLHKHVQPKPPMRPFAFGWEGGLSKIASEFSAVELQHKALDWRA